MSRRSIGELGKRGLIHFGIIMGSVPAINISVIGSWQGVVLLRKGTICVSVKREIKVYSQILLLRSDVEIAVGRATSTQRRIGKRNCLILR